MRKYVPLFEEVKFPSEFTEEDFGEDDLVLIIAIHPNENELSENGVDWFRQLPNMHIDFISIRVTTRSGSVVNGKINTELLAKIGDARKMTVSDFQNKMNKLFSPVDDDYTSEIDFDDVFTANTMNRFFIYTSYKFN